jgi:hypothetical protein
MNTTLKRTIYLLLTLIFMIGTYSMINGDLQQIIHFSGIANEIGFVLISIMLASGFAYLTVTKIEE